MTHNLTSAIVGAGLMGRWHAHAIHKLGGRVTAVVDPNQAAGERLAKTAGAQVFNHVDQLLAESPPDVLHICTPLPTHEPLARQGLAAGCHLVVEKPLTPDAASSEKLYSLAAEHQRLICPIHQFPFQNGVAKTRRWWPDLGRIVRIEATFFSAGGEGQPEHVLDDIVADILPHPLSLLQALLPGGLPLTAWQILHPRPGELMAMTAMEGTSVAVHISMSGRPPVAALRIAAEKASVHLNLFHGYAFREPGMVSRRQKVWQPFDFAGRQLSAAARNLGGRIIYREPAYPGLRRLLTDFYGAVQGSHPQPLPPTAVLSVARVRDALMKQMGPG